MADIGLSGVPGRVRELTEGLDGGGGSTESILSGDTSPFRPVSLTPSLYSFDHPHGLGRGRSDPQLMMGIGELWFREVGGTG